jgi:uncharacterized protein YqeY
MADLSEIIKEELKKYLPTLCDDVIENTVRKLIEQIGVSAVEDLTHVKEQDFSPHLKPIRARRVLEAWSKAGECADF